MIHFKFILYKLLFVMSIFLSVATLLFFLFYKVGYDPTLFLAGKNTDAATLLTLRQELGLDRSGFSQFYHFLKETVLLKWGTSWNSQQPVVDMILKGAGPSLQISLTGFLLSFVNAIVFAFITVHFKGRFLEKLLNTIIGGMLSLSFVIVVLFFQNIFAYKLSWFPVYGWAEGLESWRFAALPVLIFAIGAFAPQFLVVRSLIYQELNQPYVVTALSKGVSWQKIYFVHVFKNMTPSIVALVASQVPALLTGSLLLEIFFGVPGLGQLLVNSIQNSDFPVVKAITFAGSAFYIFSVFAGDIITYFISNRVQRT